MKIQKSSLHVIRRLTFNMEEDLKERKKKRKIIYFK
jgi:hypothetical protein